MTIFPQLKYYDRFRCIKNIPHRIISRLNIPLILSILLIDKSDNCEFFLYKYKFSNKNKNKILFLLNKYKEINIEELLDEQKLVKLAYLNNTAEIIDWLVFSTFASEKIDFNIIEKRIFFLEKLILTVFPVSAEYMKLIYEAKVLPDRRINTGDFIGPSSISLEIPNILPTNTDAKIPNINKPYTVPEKADGIRKLLYISKIGRIYFIDTNMNVLFTGNVTKHKNCSYTIIDGEHVLNDKEGLFINLFFGFDIYYLNYFSDRSTN